MRSLRAAAGFLRARKGPLPGMAHSHLLVALAPVGVGVACGSRTGLLVPEGLPPGCGADAALPNPQTCVPYDAGPASGWSPASGSILGPGVNVGFCPGGVFVYLEAPHVADNT